MAGAVCTTTCLSGSSSACPDRVDVVALDDRPDRADRGALAALHAGHVGQVAAKRRADHRREPAVLREQRADALGLVADRDAAPAHDALAGVAHERGRASRRSILRGASRPRSGSGRCRDRAPGRCSSQSALRAQVWQLPSCSERSSSTTVWRRLADARRVGLDHHALGRRSDARGHERLGALDLDQADAAGADRLHVFEVAERRHLEPA